MIWQTQQWANMLEESGQADKVLNIWWIFAEKRSIWLGLYGLFILWINKNLITKDLVETVKKISIKEKCLFFQFETLSFSGPKLHTDNCNLKNQYYKKFITEFTAVIDLDKSYDDILAAMKPKWRYNIKLAEKKGVETHIVNKTPANIKAFYDLMTETTTRDSFSWNSYEYYCKFLNTVQESKLLLSYVDQTVVAAWIFLFDREVSIYYYGASTSKKKYRNLMAPYQLQWEAIKIAKESGWKYYDFLWVAKPDAINDPLEGVTSFKRKLTPDIRHVSESYIWINSIILYTLLKFIKAIKALVK